MTQKRKERSDPDQTENGQTERGSTTEESGYYYDDAHGYQDYDPDDEPEDDAVDDD